MKILVLYDYPPPPGGLATQGDLLLRGLREIGVDAHPCHLESEQEKAWYYRWFEPDAVVGVGYWGHTPHLVLHPAQAGRQGVPWLVADGYVARHREALNGLPLLLVTSTWVKEVFARDGIAGDHVHVLPVGCDPDAFAPRERGDPRVRAAREALGVADDELLILTVGGDGASKGAREVMEALALLGDEVPPWRYVCKVWPQPRTVAQNALDLQLAATLGIADRVAYTTAITSRSFMPYLLAACDVYAAPSRLEGFGMIQVEANLCGKPVVAIDAMAFRDTMVHGETALLAGVGRENRVSEAVVAADDGSANGHRVVFEEARTVDFRADVYDVAEHLRALLTDAALRERLGQGGRRHASERFHYRTVAERLVALLRERLGLT